MGQRYEKTQGETLQEFIDKAEGLVIIPAGHYEERLVINNSHLTIVGEGQVILEQAISVKENPSLTTYQTATVYVLGNNICLKNLTIRNSSGTSDEVGQAVSLFVDGNEVYIENCQIEGHQDTLYLGQPKELLPSRRTSIHFNNCRISGDIDFIFGSAAALFENCHIISTAKKLGYLVAPATPEDQTVGFVFFNCLFTQEQVKASHYLARPWRDYAKVSFFENRFELHLAKGRWDDWGNKQARKTSEFREYRNSYLEESTNVSWVNQTNFEISMYLKYFEKVKKWTIGQ
ncbi:pectinesterase [Enterococcus sp. AZ194]|uniref:pectinesterase family protein n=1 Tax=Enterococcus sp. AZ194 TaxID=2774629 RepID=UPI003F211FF6